MISFKIRILLGLKLCFLAFVFSHESRKHEHYSFKDLREEVDGDSLTPEDQQRLFDKLHILNCSEKKPSLDYRQCFTPKDLHDFEGSAASKTLNSSEFAESSPLIVYCLLPAREKDSGQQRCNISPKNHSELFNAFARNFSNGQEGITHEALDHILEDINKTIGQFLTQKKCFSAESIIEEIKEEEDHGEEEHHGEEERAGEHHEEEKPLDQHDFEKACASIILHLVQGYCIEKGHGHNETESKLPSREFFIKDIFKEKSHLKEEDLEEITKLLGIGKPAETSVSSSSGGHNGHNHRHQRSAGEAVLPQQGAEVSHVIHRRAADSHGHEHQTNGRSAGTCYSLDDMLTVFDIDHSTGADSYDFQQLCPAFIQQAKSRACKSQTNRSKVDLEKKHMQLGKIWGYGFAAVTIISITSLVGVATIPFLGKKMYKKILALLVALAVGTLAGDSLLHLLPHAFGLHGHEEEGAGGDDHSSHSEENGFIWKALVVLASIYAFFLFEILMHLALKSKIVDHSGHSHVDIELPGPSSHHMSLKKKRKCSMLEHHEGAPPLGNSEDKIPAENGDIVLTKVEGPIGDNCIGSPSCSSHSHSVYECVSSTETEESEFETAKLQLANHADGVPQDTAPKRKKSLKQSLSRRRSVFSDEEGTKKSLQKISAVAWMIIIGDTLHNISDGLAIGAAFSEGGSSGVSGGISTSIAVFCHELPHELGDFAVLLTAGMSVKMALLANLLSALSCYIGLAIGIYIGQEGEARFWIFAIAGGMFLYVALVDMLPDLMHSETLQTEPFVTFLVQNMGLLLGFSIMLVIALYEEDLMAIQF